MTAGESSSIVAADAPGVSTSKVHKSGSGFSPARLINGSPGRSKNSSSLGMALKDEISKGNYDDKDQENPYLPPVVGDVIPGAHFSTVFGI